MESSLKKIALETIILKIIGDYNIDAQTILKQMDTKTKGYFKILDGTLYSILHKMEYEQLIESYYCSANYEKLPMKNYKITQKGKQKLKIQVDEWTRFSELLNK